MNLNIQEKAIIIRALVRYSEKVFMPDIKDEVEALIKRFESYQGQADIYK